MGSPTNLKSSFQRTLVPVTEFTFLGGTPVARQVFVAGR